MSKKIKIVPTKRKIVRRKTGMNAKQGRAKERGTLVVVLTFPVNPFPTIAVLSKLHREQIHIMQVMKAYMLDCVAVPVPVARGIDGSGSLVNVSKEPSNVNETTDNGNGNEYEMIGDNVKVIDGHEMQYRLFFSVSIRQSPQSIMNVLASRKIDEVYNNIGQKGYLGRIGIGGVNPDEHGKAHLPKRCFSSAIARKIEREEKATVEKMGFLNFVYGTSFPDSSAVPFKGMLDATMRETLDLVSMNEVGEKLPNDWNTSAEKLAYWFSALNEHYRNYAKLHFTHASHCEQSASTEPEREYWTTIRKKITTYAECFGLPKNQFVDKDASQKPVKEDAFAHKMIRADVVESIVKIALDIDNDDDIKKHFTYGSPLLFNDAQKPAGEIPDELKEKKIAVPDGKIMSECVAWWNNAFGTDIGTHTLPTDK